LVKRTGYPPAVGETACFVIADQTAEVQLQGHDRSRGSRNLTTGMHHAVLGLAVTG
jgi:hypothetical protein